MTPFSGAYWLRSKIPVEELDGGLCLVRIRRGRDVREGLFTLEARAHHRAAEFHLIYARRTAWDGSRGITEMLAFDQYRADQLCRAEDGREHAFIADFELAALQYVPEIQEFMEKQLIEALKKIEE